MSDQPPPLYETHPDAKSYGLATISLVLGILGLVCFGLITGIPAIILGFIALGKIAKSEGKLTGRGKAIAGTVTGGISVVFTTAVLAAMIIPAFTSALNKAQQMACIAQVQAINTTIIQKQIEGQSVNSLADVFPAINDPELFCCPAGDAQIGPPERVDEWSDYRFLARPNSAGSDTRVPMIHCTAGKYRHGTVVGFSDGSVEIVSDTVLGEVIGVPVVEEKAPQSRPIR